VLLYSLSVREVFLGGTSKSLIAFFTVQGLSKSACTAPFGQPVPPLKGSLTPTTSLFKEQTKWWYSEGWSCLIGHLQDSVYRHLTPVGNSRRESKLSNLFSLLAVNGYSPLSFPFNFRLPFHLMDIYCKYCILTHQVPTGRFCPRKITSFQKMFKYSKYCRIMLIFFSKLLEIHNFSPI
jgi:hypothetical protein